METIAKCVCTLLMCVQTKCGVPVLVENTFISINQANQDNVMHYCIV